MSQSNFKESYYHIFSFQINVNLKCILHSHFTYFNEIFVNKGKIIKDSKMQLWTIHLKYYVGYTNDHHFPENETERHSRYHRKNRKWKKVKRSYVPERNCFYHGDDIDINWLFHLF